jgi:hypothetical protein
LFIWAGTAAIEDDPLVMVEVSGNNPVLHIPLGTAAIYFDRNICSTKDIEVKVKRHIYKKLDDGTWRSRHDLGDAWYTVTVDSCDQNPRGFGFPIPSNLVKGTYQYRPIGRYIVNPINTKSRELPVVEFIVE